MKKQTYPFIIFFYKGEKQIIVSPSGRHTAGFSVDLEYYDIISDMADANIIGNIVLTMIEMIKISPLISNTPKEREEKAVWRMASKYKSYKSFCKNYLSCCLQIYENGEYKITALERASDNGGYNGCIKKINLSSYVTIADIGQAILQAFEAAEEFYK